MRTVLSFASSSPRHSSPVVLHCRFMASSPKIKSTSSHILHISGRRLPLLALLAVLKLEFQKAFSAVLPCHVPLCGFLPFFFSTFHVLKCNSLLLEIEKVRDFETFLRQFLAFLFSPLFPFLPSSSTRCAFCYSYGLFLQ